MCHCGCVHILQKLCIIDIFLSSIMSKTMKIMSKNFCFKSLISIFILIYFSNISHSNPITAWDKASPSVVSVLPTWPGFKKPGFGAPPGTAPEGTGIVISSLGHILTASHVISRAKKIEIRDINGNKFDAILIFNDIKTDLAIIKAEINIAPIKISIKKPQIASSTCLISNSFGLDLGITCGVISATGRKNTGFNQIENFIQTDAAANPGSSGGALVDHNGKLIGMMSGIFTKNTDTNSGVNFAVSSELILETIPFKIN